MTGSQGSGSGSEDAERQEQIGDTRRRDVEAVTVVLANMRSNENFYLGFSVSVDGDERGDGYSPLGDFELDLGDSDEGNGYDEDDQTETHGFENNGDEDGVGNRGRRSISSMELEVWNWEDYLEDGGWRQPGWRDHSGIQR
jgi:hypothetical protein